MLEIFFSVKADIKTNQQLRVVGSVAELGEWDPQRGMPLIKKHGHWECGPVEIEEEEKFQFKLVKVKENGDIQWETLPQNSNRRYRSKHSTKLFLEWSKHEGRAERFSISLGDLNQLGSLRCFNSVSTPTIRKRFNPYETAADQISSSEQSSDSEFSIDKDNQHELNSNGNQFEEIYYRSNAFQIFSGLTKITKIFVVSKQMNLQNPFHKSVLQSLRTLPRHYHVKWISMDHLSGRIEGHITSQLTVSTFFQIQSQQIHSRSLQCRNSYFVLLDLQCAAIFSQRIKNKYFGLYLPSRDYQKALQMLPSFNKNAKWIMFDQQPTNQLLLKHIMDKGGQLSETEHLQREYSEGPKLEHLVDVVVPYQTTDEILVAPTCTLSESQAFPFFTEDNSLTILEGGLADHYNQFVIELIKNKKDKSVIVIICKENHLHSLVSVLRKYNNVVIVYDNFNNIIVDNQEYQPLRRCEQLIDLFRMKVKLYSEGIGGEVVEKISSISYYLPKDKAEIAQNIYNEYKVICEKFHFVRVHKKGRKVKVSWSLAAEARTIRTICEVKYNNFGPLGNFNIISDCLSLRQLKEDLKLITEHYGRLFKEGDMTQIRYYSYGGSKKVSTCHVMPSCLQQ